MRLTSALAAVFAMSIAICVVQATLAAEENGDSAKYTIKEVMKNAHKDGLLKKVLSEQASQAEKLALLDNYISLIENAPPKGDMESWQILTGKVALAAGKVAVGREGSIAELNTATNCKACHDVHKGD